MKKIFTLIVFAGFVFTATAQQKTSINKSEGRIIAKNDSTGKVDSDQLMKEFLEILTMNVSCDLATLLCKYQATNSGVTVTGRNLLVLKKIKGTWLIILHMTVV